MSALMRFKATYDSGEVLLDETMVLEVHELQGFEKRFAIGFERGSIVITFDPALVVPNVEDQAA